MGLTWGAAWFGAGILLARVPSFYSDLPFALLFAPLGVVSGIIFSGILVVIEGSGRFDRMSLGLRRKNFPAPVAIRPRPY